ncbi:MAG: T9SS type A sorting domain-containing protein [Paludibacter sp.]
MQGFLVATNAPSSLSIPYSAVISKNSYQQKVRSTNASPKVYTKIAVSGTRYSDKMWIITNSACTHGYNNGWDGTKFLGSALAPQIWAMEPEGDYQVSGVDNINNTQLGFMCGNDSVYTLTFTHESSTSNYPALYLVDMNNNQVTDITTSGSQYTFVSKQTTVPTTARFKIVTSLGVVTEDGNISGKLNIFNSGKTVYIENNTGMKGDLMIYDVGGRFIQQHPFNASGLTTIDTNLSIGVYLLKTNASDSENIQQRIVIH